MRIPISSRWELMAGAGSGWMGERLRVIYGVEEWYWFNQAGTLGGYRVSLRLGRLGTVYAGVARR